MIVRSLSRPHQSYRHEAFLWHSRADYTSAMVAFLDEGVEAGEPTMVATTPEHLEWLRQDLSDEALNTVEFVDMTALGRNPARIIPAWRSFVSAHSAPGRPVRGLGEPIWPGRHSTELTECQLHEALLNLAIDPDTPLWLICPYDAEFLSPAVLEEAHRSHPVMVEAGSHYGSPHYGGRAHVDTLFGAHLGSPRARPRTAVFTPPTVDRMVTYIGLELYVAGMPLDRAESLAAAVGRLARGSLSRGSGEVAVSVWSDRDGFVCEVVDHVAVTDPLVGRTVPADQHDGLWEANQTCDLVQLRSTPAGTTVRIHSWR